MRMRNLGSSMEMEAWLFVLLGVWYITVNVQCQQPSTEGFISIDCGIDSGKEYTDAITGIPYTSDDQFIDRGTNYKISSPYLTSSLEKQLSTVRSFPDGARNCYTLKPVTQNNKYLVRAIFLYGNYDGLNRASASTPLLFDLQLDVNFWKTANVSDASTTYRIEAITIASADFISVCFVNNGTGTPFVSALELRPMKNSIYGYANASQSVVLSYRLNLVGSTPTDLIRYPDDRYDRIWLPFSEPYWTEISTKLPVSNLANDKFEAPSAVLQTAVTPVNSSVLEFYWDYTDAVAPVNEFYVILHFTEVLLLLPGKSFRQFDIYLNDDDWSLDYTPPYLLSGSVYSLSQMYGFSLYNYTLVATSNSTLPPLLNALEVYSPMRLLNVPTDLGDVDAIVAIKVKYQVKKNWMGDPCVPIEYAWDGLNCSYGSNFPRITSVNLSASSLSGIISTSFAMLTAVTYLDLSHNNLTGIIPDNLGELPSLHVLNLTGNNLTGSIPSSLLQRVEQGNLIMIFNNNTQPNTNGTSSGVTGSKDKKKISTPTIILLSVAPVVLILMVILIFWGVRRQPQGPTSVSPIQPKSEHYSGKIHDQENSQVQFDPTMQLESRQFTYAQLEKITNNFAQVIGHGGFGTVYLGLIGNGKQVAVKMHSQSSTQGAKEFLSEAQNLTRVHHRHLVSLIGYCNDGNYLGLVYEYLAQGSLKDHLRGRAGLARTLSWSERLRIALEAAQGLEYLHRGCTPPIIHRDMKTSNILLGEEFEAKIADFGLSKAFHSDDDTHVSTTGMAGTPGYIDPEFSFQLNEKSDVYSFGVVLLELITAHPPIITGAINVHIVQWTASRLTRGTLDDIVEERLHGDYDPNSVWMVVDVAMKCTAESRSHRPGMSEVVVQLKESLEMETAHDRGESQYTEGYDTSKSTPFEISGNISGPIGPSAR